jgi:hypothetical protein
MFQARQALLVKVLLAAMALTEVGLKPAVVAVEALVQ